MEAGLLTGWDDAAVRAAAVFRAGAEWPRARPRCVGQGDGARPGARAETVSTAHRVDPGGQGMFGEPGPLIRRGGPLAGQRHTSACCLSPTQIAQLDSRLMWLNRPILVVNRTTKSFFALHSNLSRWCRRQKSSPAGPWAVTGGDRVAPQRAAGRGQKRMRPGASAPVGGSKAGVRLRFVGGDSRL